MPVSTSWFFFFSLSVLRSVRDVEGEESSPRLKDPIKRKPVYLFIYYSGTPELRPHLVPNNGFNF